MIPLSYVKQYTQHGHLVAEDAKVAAEEVSLVSESPPSLSPFPFPPFPPHFFPTKQLAFSQTPERKTDTIVRLPIATAKDAGSAAHADGGAGGQGACDRGAKGPCQAKSRTHRRDRQALSIGARQAKAHHERTRLRLRGRRGRGGGRIGGRGGGRIGGRGRGDKRQGGELREGGICSDPNWGVQPGMRVLGFLFIYCTVGLRGSNAQAALRRVHASWHAMLCFRRKLAAKQTNDPAHVDG